ncbi:MAG TPA: GldM family protein [Bacteroidales bacterium]
METYLVFIVKASGCLSLFYLVSLILFRNSNAFKLQRFYLQGLIILSLVLPLNRISIDLFKETAPALVLEKPQSEIQENFKTVYKPELFQPSNDQPIKQVRDTLTFVTILTLIYWTTATVILMRIIYSLIYVVVYFIRSEREKEGKYTILFHPTIKGSFSFLRWIFIHDEIRNTAERESIIKHERVHADQYHSLDIIAIELLSAVMWFNPLIWLMRKEMQQLHEYLADEGVVSSGINLLEYQALLVNQVAGDRLICLPSGFKQSFIKKRLAMMTKPRISRKMGYRLLTMIPLAGLMFIVLSFTNKKGITAEKSVQLKPLIVYNLPKQQIVIRLEETKKQEPIPAGARDTLKESNSTLQIPPPPPPATSDVVAAVSPTRMNVFYLGIDNPVSIAVAGIPANQVFATIDNGTIRMSGNNYIVKPQHIGKATVQVFGAMDGNKKLLSNVEFRVKPLPDPVAKVGGKKGGTILRSILLSQTMVVADLEAFDFDAEFTVKEFTMSASISGFKTELISQGNQITDPQRNLIKQVKSGDNVYFTKIKAAGPDGKIRELPSIALQVQD